MCNQYKELRPNLFRVFITSAKNTSSEWIHGFDKFISHCLSNVEEGGERTRGMRGR